MYRLFIVILSFLFIVRDTAAQDTSIFSLPIQMDEVVVKAARSGWDLQGFIHRMQTDTTFYKAFLSLHVVPYQSENDLQVLDADRNVIASLHNTAVQTISGNCRTMRVENERITGNYYKRNGEPRYYTAELFENLFFGKGTECGITDMISQSQKGKGQMAKHKEQLKQLVFNPGSKITGVPFIGDRASIFEPSVAKLYNFKLRSVEYNGEDCYLFQAIPKPEYIKEVVFNELNTWFRKSDYSIVARDYALSYSTLLYDFNVKMKVRLQKVGERLLPQHIDYEGNWYAMTKKRERSRFTIDFKH